MDGNGNVATDERAIGKGDEGDSGVEVFGGPFWFR